MLIPFISRAVAIHSDKEGGTLCLGISGEHALRRLIRHSYVCSFHTLSLQKLHLWHGWIPMVTIIEDDEGGFMMGEHSETYEQDVETKRRARLYFENKTKGDDNV